MIVAETVRLLWSRRKHSCREKPRVGEASRQQDSGTSARTHTTKHGMIASKKQTHPRKSIPHFFNKKFSSSSFFSLCFLLMGLSPTSCLLNVGRMMTTVKTYFLHPFISARTRKRRRILGESTPFYRHTSVVTKNQPPF